MIPIPQEQFNMALRSAPRPLRELVGASETTEKMINVQNKYGVKDPDRSVRVSALTAYVLLGVVPTTKFIPLLEKDASLDPKTARGVAYDIRNNIFAPVAEELAQLQDRAEKQWKKAQAGSPGSTTQEERITTPEGKQEPPVEQTENETRGTPSPDESVARPKPPENNPPNNLPTESRQQQGPSSDERMKSEIFPEPSEADPEQSQSDNAAGSREQRSASGGAQTETDRQPTEEDEGGKKPGREPRKFLDNGTVNLKDNRF